MSKGTAATSFICLIIIAVGGAVVSGQAQTPRAVAGPIVNPLTHHQYYLLEPSSWTNAEAAAIALGGHLVTINSGLEQNWLYDTFANFDGVGRDLWIGLYNPNTWSDGEIPGLWVSGFVWSSGEPFGYSGWAGSEWASTNTLRSGYCKMYGPNAPSFWDAGSWVEEEGSTLLNAIAELPPALEILAQPQSISVPFGANASFSVNARGTFRISYQWMLNGTNLPGEPGPILTLTNVPLALSGGAFSVVVTNASGAITSAPAFLTVSAVASWSVDYTGPPYVPDDIPSGLGVVKAVSGGGDFSLAILDDETVRGWGVYFSGQTTPPSDLSNVVAIAAGGNFGLALKSDSTIVAWGNGSRGQTDVPAGLRDVIAISAGYSHCLALKTNQEFVPWGYNQSGYPLPLLTNAVAIASGDYHNLVLAADGTVVGWPVGPDGDRFGETMVPEGLKDVVAIAAGALHSLALRSDGTIVAWGSDGSGQVHVPVGLSNVVAISAGAFHSVALKQDGTVVSWGRGSTVPSLSNVKAIDAGVWYSLALLGDGSPSFTVQPWSRSVFERSAVKFTAKSVGLQPLAYQWVFNGNDIPGATDDHYCISKAKLTDAGAYSLSVSNSLGAISCRPALLVVATNSATTNCAPILPEQHDFVACPLTELVVTNTAALCGDSTGVLHYVLVQPPPGATIDEFGLIDWTPGADQAHTTNFIVTVVVDDSLPPLSATNSFRVIVENPGETAVPIIAGPIVNLANGHQYLLLGPASWTNAELAAVALGGHLVTINTPAENDWVYQTFANFAGIPRDLWLGLFLPDPSSASQDPRERRNQFVWISGQPATAQVWAETNLLRSGFCKLWGPANPMQFDRGRWAEEFPTTLLNSVIELPLPLEIVSQPKTISVGIGSDATFTVVADGTSPLYYQWQSSGTNLPGQTRATLILTNMHPADSGSFSVQVSNSSGILTSDPASFSVAGLVCWGAPAGVDTRTNIPPGLTNILAIAAGDWHDLALKSDGTVLTWGNNDYSQLSIPADLTNVVAIAGALYHSLALKADGTVVSWGYYPVFIGNWVPAGLADVVAIDANGYHNLALKHDGTVVAWGGDGALPSVAPAALTNAVAISAGSSHNLALRADRTVAAWIDTIGELLEVPADVTNVVAISAGTGVSLALRADGTVVAWGEDWYGQLDVPAGLSNVVAIAAKCLHCLALKSDGSVVAWGDNWSGESTVPLALPNVVAIAAGSSHSLALLRDGAPCLTIQPWDLSVQPGSSPTFAAKAVGLLSMTYQWQFNGTDLAGATHETLSISNAQPVHQGVYTLSVSNKLGLAASRKARLIVSSVAPVTTNLPPLIEPIHLASDMCLLRVRGVVGPRYTLQASADLVTWVNLQTVSPLSMPFELTNFNNTASTKRFFRIQLGP